MDRIDGLIAAPYTPMHVDGSLRLGGVEELAGLLVRNGVSGVFVGGSTGEGVALTAEERRAMVRAWVQAAPGGFRVIVHVGHTCAEVSRELARNAEDEGADAVGYMAPFFFKPPDVPSLVDACAEVASATALPFYYYHIPVMTGVSLPMRRFLLEAAERIPTLAGLKFTCSDLMDLQLCMDVDGGRFEVLFGTDEMLLAGLALGCRGAIGSTYNFAAPLYLDIRVAMDAGDLDRARALQRRSAEMVAILADSPAPFLSASKAVMGMIGVECGPTRLPLRPLNEEQVADLRDRLEAIEFFEWCNR